MPPVEKAETHGEKGAAGEKKRKQSGGHTGKRVPGAQSSIKRYVNQNQRRTTVKQKKKKERKKEKRQKRRCTSFIEGPDRYIHVCVPLT